MQHLHGASEIGGGGTQGSARVPGSSAQWSEGTLKG